jgi:hypothetical protein
MWLYPSMVYNNKSYNNKVGEKMSKMLIGSKIVNVREMTEEEASGEAWELGRNGCRVLILDNGVKLYASRDYEGNGPGALFFTKDKKCYAI